VMRVLPKWLCVVALVCGVGSLPSCASSDSDAAWIEADVKADTERILWQVTVLALERNGYPIGSGVNPNELKAVSGWRTSLAPFKGDGFRDRAHVYWQRDAQDPKRWHAKVRVERQSNENLSKPLDISYAEWEDQPDDQERARLVLNTIKALLGGEFKLNGGPSRTQRTPGG